MIIRRVKVTLIFKYGDIRNDTDVIRVLGTGLYSYSKTSRKPKPDPNANPTEPSFALHMHGFTLFLYLFRKILSSTGYKIITIDQNYNSFVLITSDSLSHVSARCQLVVKSNINHNFMKRTTYWALPFRSNSVNCTDSWVQLMTCGEYVKICKCQQRRSHRIIGGGDRGGAPVAVSYTHLTLPTILRV